MNEETNIDGIPYDVLIEMRLRSDIVWSFDLFMIEEYANHEEWREAFEEKRPAIKELPA